MSDKRLIDANALHKRIEMNLRASNPFTIEECCYKDALNSVDEASDIDPETLRPVGLWTLEGNDDDVGCSYFCSNCRKSVDEDWFFPSAIPGLTGTECKPFKYCPYCGAKMEE